MNAKMCAVLFSVALLVVSTNAGRLQYVFHTDENFKPSVAGSQQVVHLVKRSNPRSRGSRYGDEPCPSFSASRCHHELPALCVEHRLNSCKDVDHIFVEI